MTENHILVKTTEQHILENILLDLANLYSDTEYVKGIQLYRKKGQTQSFMILFMNNPDLDRFSYFTNYLEYPFDFKNFKSTVRGFYKTSDVNNVPKLKKGKWLMIYINENDKNGDNVYIVNELNETCIYDFGGKVKELDNSIHKFNLYNVDISDYNHIIDIFPSPTKKNTEEKPWWKFW